VRGSALDLTTGKVGGWLLAHPRFVLHFTSTSCSWSSVLCPFRYGSFGW
jgi:hypothetical protein